MNTQNNQDNLPPFLKFSTIEKINLSFWYGVSKKDNKKRQKCWEYVVSKIQKHKRRRKGKIDNKRPLGLFFYELCF